MKSVPFVLRLDKKLAVMVLLGSLLIVGMMPLSKASANLFTNPSFAGPFVGVTSPAAGQVAPGWQDNSFGTVGVTYAASSSPKYDTPGYAQAIEVNSIASGSGVQFLQNCSFTSGDYYQASVWLRGSVQMPVELSFRINGSPYTTFADTQITVQPYWQQFWVSGSYDSSAAGRFQIRPEGQGILYVDDADLEDTTSTETKNRQIQFSGYNWLVRDSGNGLLSPGGSNKNYWNNSSNNVWVDGSGYLHIKMTHVGSKWYCPDVSSVDSFGLGTYQFWVVGEIDNFDPGVVFGLFSYPSTAGRDGWDEVDMEFTQWGDSGSSTNADFNVWPKYPTNKSTLLHPSTSYRYPLDLDDAEYPQPWTTLRYTRNSNNILFEVLGGHVATTEHDSPFETWTYDAATDNMVPDVAINSTIAMPVHLDLWNYTPPLTGASEVELVISNFTFVPS